MNAGTPASAEMVATLPLWSFNSWQLGRRCLFKTIS